MTDRDQELIRTHLERIVSTEHVLEVVEQYGKKWHELERSKVMAINRDTTFVSGRQTGYVEVLSALLGVEFGSVRDMLRNDQL